MRQAEVRRGLVLAGVVAAFLIALIAPARLSGQPEACYYGNDDVGHACADLTLSVEGWRFLDGTKTLEITVVVTNDGGADSTATTVQGVASGWDPASTAVPALKQGGDSTRVVLSFDVKDERRGQTDRFVVTVDPDDVVEEPTDDNNTASPDVAVPVADLTIPRIVYRFTDEATLLELTVQVSNVGNAPSTTTQVRANFPDGRSESREVQALEPGDSRRFVLTVDVPEERQGRKDRFEVTVDPSGEDVVETAKDNNTSSRSVRVPAPDLAVAPPTYRVTDDGNELELTVTVRNEGRARSAATVVEGASPGWDTQIENVGPLSPAASESVRLVFDIKDELRGRTHRFSVAVDPGAEVPDSSPENNSRTTTVLIGAAPASTDESGFPFGIALALAVAVLALGGAFYALRGLRSRRSPARVETEGPPRAEPPPPRSEPAPPRPGPTPTGAAPPPPSVPHGADFDHAMPTPLPQFGEKAAGAPSERFDEQAPPAERVVSTGFASRSPGRRPVDPNRTLVCAEDYYFWLEVGAPVAGSIEDTPSDLPVEQLPADAHLTVALFAIDGSIELADTADIGNLRLERGGRVVVERQPGGGAGFFADPDLGLRRLFFPVRTPNEERLVQFRCNIYCDQLLVQSRLIRAHVTRAGRALEGALTSSLDYTLAPRLEPALLGRLPEHRLSLLLNKNGDGTHGLAFYGAKEFKSSASFDGEELQDLVEQARGALRRAAWGDEEPWQEGKVYLYESPAEGQFETDVIRFAIRGFRFYAAIIDRLAGGSSRADALGRLMERPGLVQIATKESPRHLLPASMIYDYVGFDTTARFSDYRLCPAFLDALERETSLDGHGCFIGDCPSRGEETVVCPSGFWGYRHGLGMPLSVAKAPDAPSEIYSRENTALVVAVSTDPVFTLRSAHEQALQALQAGLVWNYASTRADAIRLMKQARAEIVYFYCHGGVQDNVPFIQVGPLDERGITADYILSQRIRWDSPRPLIFINGCHTTALEPERALEFVSVLVRRAQAAGVIGTEITVFEPLARVFAEDCLRRFLAGEAIGEAIRGARLSLLKIRNPLGLAYLGFVLAGLRIVRRRTPRPPRRAQDPAARVKT